MNFKFKKYQGTGNDFIMIDSRAFSKEISSDFVKKVCDRRFGIGADGLIIVKEHLKYDFEMNYYNADGSQSFCGNGSRCAQAFAKDIGIIGNKSTFLAIDGEHQGESRGPLFATKMCDVKKTQKIGEDYFIHTGSPHYIKYVDDVELIDVYKEGAAIRNSTAYKKEGINVNFVSYSKNYLKVRTYERGVEDETYSCGTGVTAVAISYLLKTQKSIPSVELITKGGLLNVELEMSKDGTYRNIWLIGPAIKVFEGDFSL